MHNSDYYREQAEHYRQLAAGADDPAARQELLELAAACDEAAQWEKPMSMTGDDNRQARYARWRNSDVSRNFHRLGLLVAAIILLAGLLLMAKDALGIRFWDLIPADIPILAGGIAVGLTGIGLVSLAAYGFIRAIGWAIDRSV